MNIGSMLRFSSAAAVMLTGVLFSATDARAKVLLVNCAKGPSIQASLAKAAPGDTVEILGTCKENIVIRIDRVKLACGPGDGIVGANSSAASNIIEIRAGDVRISDCSISGSGDGIAVLGSGSATIKGNTIKGANNGIVVDESSNAMITGNRIVNSVRNGVLVKLQSDAGILDNPAISGNGIDGIAVVGATADVAGNTVEKNSRHGVFAVGGGRARLSVRPSATTQKRTIATSRVRFSGHASATTQRNKISRNGANGIHCGADTSLRFSVTQDYGAGNTRGNTALTCSVFGVP